MKQFNDIYADLRSFASLIATQIREIARLPYAKTYLLAAPVLVILFCIMTFPYEILIRNELRNIEEYSSVSVFAGEIDFHLIGDTTFDRIQVVLRDGGELHINEIIANANTIGMMMNYLLKRDIQINGSIAVNGLKAAMSDFNASGSASSNVDVSISRNSMSLKKGTISLILQNASLRIGDFTLPEAMGGMDIKIPPMQFPTASAEIVIDENSIQIKNSLFSGSDLRGKVIGVINRNKVFMNSSLNLTASVDGSSKLIDKYRPLLTKYINNDKIEILVKGTMAHPVFEFKD